MKRLCSLVFALLFVWNCSAQSGMKRFYQRYASQEQVTQLHIPRFLVRLAADDAETRRLLRHMGGLRIFLAEQPDQLPARLHTDLVHALAADHFEDVLQIRDGGDRVGIYSVESKEMIRQLLLVVEDGSNLVVLHAHTQIHPDKLAEVLTGLQSGKGKKGFRQLYSMKQ